jgi:glutamate/tyrosine decarboxylase-like PLP-dependent enzyme
MTDHIPPLFVGAATDQQRAFLDEAMRLGLSFLDGSARGGAVIDYQSLTELRHHLAQPLPLDGMPFGALLDEVRNSVVRYSIAQCDQRYLAFPDTGNSLAGIAAGILSSFLNQNLIAFDRSAPSATIVEIELLQWLRELIGYSHKSVDAPGLTLADVGGIWTSGGNMSNHVAVLVALHSRFPGIARTGLHGLTKKPVIVLARGIEHFSFASAALSLGLGRDSLVWIKSGPDYTTDTSSLRATLDSLDPGCEPFMVVGIAGNCRTTGIDDISAIRDVCDEYNIWLHVDACHGGSLLFSEKLRGRLAGIEKAQSVSLDPHKGLFVGYPCSYVLFKDPTALSFVCRYPDKLHDPDCLDLGLIMPFYGSRGFDSLKLWMLIKNLGVRGIGALIERRQDLNNRLVRRLKKSGWFTLLNDGSFYRTAFVFYPATVRLLAEQRGLYEAAPEVLRKVVNRATTEFSERLYQSGAAVFDAFSLADLDNRVGLGCEVSYSAMAMAVGQPDMDQAVEEGIFHAIDTIAFGVAEMMYREVGIAEHAISRPDALGSAVAAIELSKGPAGW